MSHYQMMAQPTACISISMESKFITIREGIWILNWKFRKDFFMQWNIFGTAKIVKLFKNHQNSQKVLKYFSNLSACKLLNSVWVCVYILILPVSLLCTFTPAPCCTSRNLLFQDIFVYSHNRSLFLSKDFVCCYNLSMRLRVCLFRN